MKKAFTMIELIFVIVIIGILAAVAIPKLSATRDDAKISSEIANLKTCVTDLTSSYTAIGKEDNSSTSCITLTCFTVDLGDSITDGNLTVNDVDSDEIYCTESQSEALKLKLSGEHIVGGSRVIR